MFMLFLILHMSFWVKVGTSALDDLVAGKNYDKSLRPLYGERPMNVTSETNIATLGPIKEQDMTFELSFYQRQWWNDPRLAHNGTLDEITSNVHPGGTIWMPDVYIVNAREVTYLNDFTRTVIQKNGDVYFSQKVSAKCICNMDLRRYPLDKQTCQLQMESYAFSKQDVHLKWTESGISVPENDKLSLTGYEVLGASKSEKDIFYGDGEFYRFSNLFLDFEVKRTSVYYVYKAFLPTLFLSIFNLGSYFIPDDAMPARVTLIITTFLANMLILQSISDQTVQVSYTTAMQLFLLVNVLFLMTSIVQYLVLLHLRKVALLKKEASDQVATKKDHNKKETTTEVIHLNDHFDATTQEVNAHGNLNTKTHFHKIEKAFTLTDLKTGNVHILDRVFRVIMPFLYLLFCTVYFSYYLF